LLAVPSLKKRYLSYIREIVERSLDWTKLGPVVNRYQALITDEVKIDTRKLESFEAFQSAVAEKSAAADSHGSESADSLNDFVEQRRAFLLKHPEIKNAGS